MTQRERHTPAIGGPAPAMATSPNGAGPACAWEELFQAAAPGRRQQLIALAGREGVLYAHELPPPGNGAAARPLLPALLNGQLHDLSPLRPSALPCDESPLDDSQRDAVARALQTPDLCLIQGYPGSGKSHTAAEIAGRAAARGERVLLLAPTAAAVDCVLERLDGRDGVCAARCPAAGEKAEALPPGLRRLAFAERLRLFHEQTLPAAKLAADEAGRRLAERRAEEGAWAALDEIAGRLQALAEEKRRLAEGLSRVEEEVGAETEGAAPFHQELAACRAGRDEALARIDARLAELRAEGEKVRGEGRAADDEAARLRPLAEALTSGRWWTGAWWTARREGDLPKRLAELENRRNELTQAQDRLTREAEERTAERDAAESHYQETVDRLRREEVGRRRAEGECRLAALAHEQASLKQKAEAAHLGAAPADLSPAGVAAARAAWHGLREQDERQAAQASQWAGAVESVLDTLPERLARCVNVVGAVTSALAADPHFGDHAAVRAPFDLLILEEAHLVTESEFLAAARRARRWVLVGEPADDARAPRQATRPSALRPGFFQRLWRLLHADPRALPYAWIHRAGRLVCRLRPAAPDEERWIESERLADRPEIELRIAAPPRTPPRLLEVAFPGTTDICEAKEFIYRELGELTVEAPGGAFLWREDSECVTLDLSDGAAPGPTAVDLAEGVRERLAAAAPEGDGAARHTATLEFARAAGWTRERAELWVEEHLQTRALGRTALLATPHRCLPSLARFLSSLLFDGACGAAVADGPPAVEFVPVPPPDRGAARRRDDESLGRQGGTATAAPRLRQARGGAGLEIDLGDPRRLDPLPADLRAALPGRGLVNLFEARAVLRKLECLAADPAFRAAAAEWARRAVRPTGTGCASAACRESSVPCAGRRPAVAVLALHFAQAELIRLLMTQSPALSASPLAVEVGTPDAFRHRECFAAVVSLTRSHSHRAVPFGDDPTFLPTALTRAVARLVLVGDPGTLARRCQWNGAIDHLDETAGERERRLIARITAYLHGDGPHPTLFRLDESAGV